MTRVSIEAPAKINLRLRVLAREVTGYHALETLFCGISLADQIEIEEAGSETTLEVSGGVDVGPIANNLVLRAVRAFDARLGESRPLRIRLHKNIPAAAGLGGGSSDAAATLRALNALRGQPLDDSELRTLGASLGSDVPFFLTGTPFALAWNRGDRLLELVPPPARHVLLTFPGVAISTPTAYARLDQVRPHDSPTAQGFSIPAGQIRDWTAIASFAENDFEVVARDMISRFDQLKDLFARAGAEPALLSGSGSSIFAIFGSQDSLEAAEEEVRALGFETRRAATLLEWPQPVPHH